MLENAMRGAKRAAALTERLLAFARTKPLEPCVLDANGLVSGMSDLLQRTIGDEIVVRTLLAEDLWPIEVDPAELETALLNLAVNARDAMPAGGTLTIETANVELDCAYAATNTDVTAGLYVLISVADTGTGMPSDVLKQVFEPFFTTKQDGLGTGLGLSQVYGFVKQSGGEVKLYSEPGLGTTVNIYLPRARESEETAGWQAVETESSTEKIPLSVAGEAILVVEDDEDVRNFTAGSLRELGYRVLEAGDAAAAREIVELEPEIQLLFTDLGLPGGTDGKALADQVQKIRPSLRVLITTAYAGSALVHDGRLDSGVDLLSKPFTVAALATRIRDLLDRNDNKDNKVVEATNILLVEDEALLRMLIADVLTDAGYHVEEAASFREGLSKMKDGSVRFAGAVIDLGLPDRPGDELIAEVRAINPGLVIVLATGFADGSVRRRFADDKGVHILVKPFQPEALIEMLPAARQDSAGRRTP
jgi:DNA-binding response OmpR family regulator